MSRRERAKASAAEEPEAPREEGWLEQIGTMGLAVLLALAIRAFVIEPYRIPSTSMLPTLLVGDHLFVNKFVYGPKIPFTDLRLPGLREPERGDVVVFTVAKGPGGTAPRDRRRDLPGEQLVKRIVGMPGDRIEFRGERMLVNGEVVASQPQPEDFVDGAQRLQQNAVQIGDHDVVVLDDPGVRLPNLGPYVVEEGRYFMMGDNRDHSHDSRFWGTVRLAEMKGPAFRIYWSWDYNDGWIGLLNPLTWWRLLTRATRWERMGAPIP